MKWGIIAGMLLLACPATSFCQGDSFDDFFHSNQKAKEEAPGVIHLEGAIMTKIQDGLYVVNVDPDCAEKYGFGHSHDDPSYLSGPNGTVTVEHNAVHEWVRVVLRGEPQDRNDVTIGCWVMKDGHYRYTAATGHSEILPAYKVCAAPSPSPTPGSSGADSKLKGSASGQ